jgi:DUF1009 family protein
MPPEREPIGLLAGWGRYPILVAEALRRQGRAVCCLGGIEHADPALRPLCDRYAPIGLGQLGGAIRQFRRWGVRDATMAGKLHKVRFYEPRVWWRNRPDLRALRAFFRSFVLARDDRRDDTLLGIVVKEFARDGIRFLPPTDFAPELLVKQGQLTRRGPTAAQRQDIRFGWRLAKELGRLDVGQSVAVRDRACLAVEAIEGTDECIRRAGELCRAGEFTVVKVAKPQQDMRFDVPTIGLQTLETLRAAGGRVLAIEADRTVVLDQPEVIAYADRHGLVVVALETGETLEYDGAHTCGPETTCHTRER